MKAKGFEFSSEVIGKVCQATDNYIQRAVTLHKDKRNGEAPKLSAVRDGIRHLAMILFNISL